MAKVGCTVLNTVIFCVRESNTGQFYLNGKSNSDVLNKVHQDMIAGPSKVFKPEVVFDATLNRKFPIICKQIVDSGVVQNHRCSVSTKD